MDLGAQSNDKYLCLRFDNTQYLRFITASFIWRNYINVDYELMVHYVSHINNGAS